MKLPLLGLALLYSTVGLAASYEETFPNYFEYCTGTQVKYQPAYFDGGEGGAGGHGFMYIHGLCKDYSKNYPQVVPCASGSDHKGVGVSLDSDFQNVAWVAVPGRGMTMYGDKKRSKITNADVQSVAQRAVELKIFENVKMKPDYVNKHAFNSADYQKAAAIYSFGTDLAVSWGRELRCARIPVTRLALFSAAKYLNEVNDKYYKNNVPYEWSGFKNNCTHLAINTSHAMGMNSSVETDRNALVQVFNLAVPANAYLMYVEKMVLEEASERNIVRSQSFKNFGFHSSQVGSLMTRIKVYPSNAMFKTDDLNSITLPRFSLTRALATPESYDRYLRPDNSEMKANALKWRDLYSKMEGSREGLKFENYLKQQKAMAAKIIKN